MDTEIYGQIPIFSREQVRKAYAQSVKSQIENLEQIVEEGIMPFPNKQEMMAYDEGIERGLNMALSKIEDSGEVDLPNIFMIDTEKRDEQGNRAVWIVAEGKVVDFTESRVFHESNLAA